MEVRNPLNGLPKQIGSALGDIRKIAEGMQTLPALLKTIEGHVASMEEEVKLMRTGVDSLEDRLDEVGSALHPVRRAFGRRNTDST